jgi:hypothetical protein
MTGRNHSSFVKPTEYRTRVRPGVVWSLVTMLWQFGSLLVKPVALCAGVDLGEAGLCGAGNYVLSQCHCDPTTALKIMSVSKSTCSIGFSSNIILFSVFF